jgi:tetratricopeptide (TPR) repeat protein
MKDKKNNSHPLEPERPSGVASILLVALVIIVGAHIWGALQPSHDNWGFHFFGFYDRWVGILALAVVLAAAIPTIQTIIIKKLDTILRSLTRLPISIVFVVTVGFLIALVYYFPAKLHLLGDGAVLLRSVPLGINSTEISTSFRNQPLMFWMYRLAMNAHPFEASPNPYTVYYSIDIIALFLFIALVFWSMRQLPVPVLEKVLLGCLIVFSAGTQFYFGYVENYVLQYTMTIGFILTGWYALEKRTSIVVPILFFVLMIMLHLGNIVFIPGLILLLLLQWKKNLKRAILFIAAIGVIGTVVLYIAGFNLIDMTRHLQSGTVDILQPFTAVGGNFAYPMFSFMHLLDWFNSAMLTAPLGLLMSGVLIFLLPAEHRWKNPVVLFLLGTVGCGIFFTWVINSALGLMRDWDLFAGFFVPLMIVPIYVFSQSDSFPGRRYTVFLSTVILLVSTASWIGVNASEQRHLDRMEMLNSHVFLSKAAQMAHHEALANFYFDTRQYRNALGHYESYVAIDPNNPRIIGNIADVYRKLGERDKYFNMLKRAVAMKSPDPGIYSNLGVEYAARNDTAQAIFYNEEAIKQNPTAAKAHANLGILYASRGEYTTADQHFSTAISLGMAEPQLYRYAGDVCIHLRDYTRALQNYDIYLATNPGDARVRSVRQQVFQVLTKQNATK